MFFKFCEERIATVSEAAATAFAAIISKFQNEPQKQLNLINKIKKEYREGTYKKRQLYLIMAASIMNRADMKKIFVDHFKEDTLSLAYDTVPNVRIGIARVIKAHFRLIDGQFVDDKRVNEVVNTLSTDAEQDVRNVVAQIKEFHSMDDLSSEVSSLKSTPFHDEAFVDGLKQKYDGDHSDLSLS
jgi:predicted lactoylglutathione lyase